MPLKKGGVEAPSPGGPVWAGDVTHWVNDEKYYRAFVRDGVEYRVGDVVTLEAGPKSGLSKYRDNVYVAEIESLWEDCYGTKWAETRW